MKLRKYAIRSLIWSYGISLNFLQKAMVQYTIGPDKDRMSTLKCVNFHTLQLKKYCLSRSSKKYAKQNLNVESISYKSVVQEGLRL